MKTKIIWILVMVTLFGVMVTTATAAETAWSDTFTDSSNISASENITVAGGDVKLDNSGTDHGGADWSPGTDVYGCHYNIGTCTINGATVKAYSGGDYGWLEIHATTINVVGSGLNGIGKGYPGGNGSGHYYYGGPGGPAWYPERGTGDGGTHNEVDGAGQYPTTGEHYKLSSGGGGGYGGEGGLGCSYWTGQGVGFAAGGDAFGTSDTYQLKIGAGGAGGGGGYELPYKWGGDGGAGGAGILLDAHTIAISGAISINGEDGEDGESGYKGCGGGGGGAGGSIVIKAGTLSGAGSLYAEGGDGGDAGDGSPAGGHAAGGAGGGSGGRIKIWYNTSTFTGSHSVINGSGGAHGENAEYGHGIDGYPGEIGTYYSAQESYSPYSSSYKPRGYLNSTAITPTSFESWDMFYANHSIPSGTNTTYRILNASDNSTLCEVNATDAAAGYNIPLGTDSTTSIRLYAFLNTTNTSKTSVLHDWNVSWTPNNDLTPPTLTFVPPTPANNSEVNVDYVFVNVTLNESGNTAILNWNGSNETMLGSGMNFHLNKAGLSNEIYTFKVYANDTSDNWNVSETRIVTINATQTSTPPVEVPAITLPSFLLALLSLLGLGAVVMRGLYRE